MTNTSVQYTYKYPFNSELDKQAGHLKLATSELNDNFPYFFEGKILNPKILASLLNSLAQIVSTRFYTPPNMLKKILVEKDPVITSGGGLLRFEGFSACASTYARVDLTPDGYDGKIIGNGTTNVDFNTKTRHALNTVGAKDRLSIAVGADEFMLTHGFQKITERKVELPKRWIKGFVEVQAYQSRMEERFSINKVEALRFFRSLPRNALNKSDFFVVSQRNGLRLAQKAGADDLKISGMKRLNIFRDLAPHIESLTIYADRQNESSQWCVDLEGMRFSLTMSRDVARGFSGEGQVLKHLTGKEASSLSLLRAALNWQSAIDAEFLTKDLGLNRKEIDEGLALLGSQGLVGYDTRQKAYFHRELPFNLESIESVHPRLKGARNLVDKNRVKITETKEGITYADVEGSGVTHKVKVGGVETCTCPWHSKYQGRRGQCKHILAVLISTRESNGKDLN